MDAFGCKSRVIGGGDTVYRLGGVQFRPMLGRKVVRRATAFVGLVEEAGKPWQLGAELMGDLALLRNCGFIVVLAALH
ncbi:hypothetical protein [Bradyrhizobium sp.]|uniref:hypothetical protein n=1 Tax=Bradyrhizobium sp. TaxID=376 RepID=UPI0012E6FF41|nr:hypothetical protein [Bradyrhizobium sp.]